MSIIPKLLKSRQRFPKPLANWNFTDFSKIQAGATSVDVAGWTGESLKAGLATVDLTQTTAAAQPVWVQGYDLTGSNLVINGTFDDASNWVLQTNWSIAGGVATGSGASGASGARDLRQTGILTIGKTYIVTLEITQYTSGTLKLWDGSMNTNFPSSVGVYSIIFTQSINTDLNINSPDFMGSIDNVTVFEAVENNSKSHAAFDGSDYLEGMPTQSGDFTYITSLSTVGTSSQIIYGSSSSNTPQLVIASGASGFLNLRTSLNVSNVMNSVNMSDGVKRVIALVRSGNDYTVYVDGIAANTITDTGSFIVDWLGSRLGAGIEFEGKIYNTLIFPSALTATEVAAKTASLA